MGETGTEGHSGFSGHFDAPSRKFTTEHVCVSAGSLDRDEPPFEQSKQDLLSGNLQL